MKPEKYDGKDAVTLKCLREYKVDDGTADPVTFEKGKTYDLSPRSAAHLSRKQYNMHDDLTAEEKRAGKKRGQYIGDGFHFIDEKAAAAMKKAEAEAKAENEANAKQADAEVEAIAKVQSKAK